MRGSRSSGRRFAGRSRPRYVWASSDGTFSGAGPFVFDLLSGLKTAAAQDLIGITVVRSVGFMTATLASTYAWGIRRGTEQEDADDVNPQANPYQDWMGYGLVSTTVVEDRGGGSGISRVDLRGKRRIDEPLETLLLGVGAVTATADGRYHWRFLVRLP